MTMGDGVTVLAIDPGRSKCGVAIVRRDEGILARSVVHKEDLRRLLHTLIQQFHPDVIVLGCGTGMKDVEKIISSLDSTLKIEIVDENYTSIDARKRFFKENPPRGLKRLIPTTLQTPNVAYDDYVAVILAERYLSKATE